MNGFAIVPSTRSDFVELARTPRGTKLFKKHILSKGTLHYNGDDISIDDAFFDALKKNFTDGVCDIVQVPIADAKNQHTEDPLRNIGEVVELREEDDKLYAIIDARKKEAADELGNTLLGASAFFSTNYEDKRTGKKAGPTLLHVAVTNRPHEVGLEDYEELIAATAESSSDAVYLTAPIEETKKMDRDELISALKVEHNIDVTDLQRRAAEGDKAVALSNSLTAALGGLKEQGLISLSNSEEASADDLVGAIGQLAEKNVELSAKVDTLVETSAKDAAEARVDKLISDGFITPAKKQANIDLLLSNPENFEALLPEKPLVALSAEDMHGSDDTEQTSAAESELVRLSNLDAAKQYIH
jgi:hypothetical protein